MRTESTRLITKLALNSATADTCSSVLSTSPSTSAPETANGENAPACPPLITIMPTSSGLSL